MATVSAYPTIATVRWLKQLPAPPEFSPMVNSHQYEDGGKSFNLSSATGILEWQLEYDGLTVLQAYDLDQHNLEACGEAHDFSFVDRDGITHTGVHYKSYTKDWNKIWAQSRKVTLCKYPG